MACNDSYYRLLILFSLSLLLSACSVTSGDSGSTMQDSAAPAVLSQIDQPAQFYLDQVKLASKAQSLNWQFLAARAFVAEGHSQPALAMLQKISRNNLSQQQAFELALIKSEAYLLEKRYQAAATALNFNPTLSTSFTVHWQRYYLLQATIAELRDDSSKAVAYRVALNDFLEPTLQPTNNLLLWQQAKLIPPLELAQLIQPQPALAPTQSGAVGNSILIGWYQLAAIAQQYAGQPQALIAHLQRWQHSHLGHPALTAFPPELVRAMTTQAYAPNQIAILAPLTGKLGTTGKAIRDGILSAYYQQELQDRVKLRFYDTAAGAADQLYLQALEEGADFVIGPLLKSNLTKVLPLVKDVPLLSLNKLDANPVNDNIYYFSLTSNDESQAAAKRMLRDGIQHPLVLTPNNSVGNRLAKIFSQEWQALTNERSEVYRYNSRRDMQNTVTSLFAVNDSNLRIRQMKNLLGNDIEAKTRSRRDIDAIYIIATPSEAMLAIPYINTTQNPYTKQVAVYGSSRTHSSSLSKNQTRDLSGLTFSDMPWLLNPDQGLKQQTLALWPSMSKIEQNLFAMGYDAFKLIPNLQQLRNFPELHLNGQTGILYVNDAGVIEREFSWAKYRAGKIKLEESATEISATP